MIPATLGLLLFVAPAADEPPPRPLEVCLVSGSAEYRSDESLAKFARFLEGEYPARCTLIRARGERELPGTEELDRCDLAVFFTRRLEIDGEALERVRAYATRSGKPVVGIRTASHGFQKWLELDPLVFGGNYRGHYRNDLKTEVAIAPGAADHPIVAGFDPSTSNGSLYKVSPLADDCVPLLMGTSPEGAEPVAWVRDRAGARVFYTSLGHPDDFDQPAFRRLLARGIFWAAGRTDALADR